MNIRKATIEDYQALKSLKILSKKEELRYSTTLKPLEETEKYYHEYLHYDLSKPNRGLFIAEADGKIIGMILGKFFTPLRISVHAVKGHISNLYIDKDYRGKGIAKQLIRRVSSWLKEQGVSQAALEIHVENKPALKLYECLGFERYTLKLIKDI